MTAQTWTADELRERIFEACLASFDVFSIYLGISLGYYPILADGHPVTSDELATRSRTAERYAREWLEQQAMTGLLEVEDAGVAPMLRRFRLPPGYAEVLTDRDSLSYLGPAAAQTAAAGLQLEHVAEAFRTGTGVRWEQYGGPMRVAQGEMNRPLFLDVLPNEWLPAIRDVHKRLSSADTTRVADFGCGHGWSAIGIAAAYPNTFVDGYDVDGPSIEEARENAAAMGMADRVAFHFADVTGLDLEPNHDLVIALECVHDLPDPVGFLRTMRDIAAPGAGILVVDEAARDEFVPDGDPLDRFLYGFSITTCLPDGMSHPGSAATGTVMRPATFERYAAEAGFGSVEVLPIEHDQFRIYSLHG